MHKKNIFGKRNIISMLLVILLFAFSVTDSYSEAKKGSKVLKHDNKDIKLFPDEYGELDEVPVPKSTKDDHVLKILEKSRQKYLQALIMIERKDTVAAAKYFEDAMNTLNPLVSYPNIEKNDDFTELAQSIIEDYESFITNIDNLNENSSLFIFRDKLFQEMEHSKTTTTTQTPKIQPIETKTADTAKAVAQAKEEDKFSVPMDDNEHVQKMIEFLTKNKIGNKYIRNCIERASRWIPLMKRIIAEEKVPEELIFLAMTESALNPTVVSRAKAVGLWQFIRSTGEAYGLNANGSVWVDERRNPEKATRAAARHLRDLYNELGDWHLAFAAYNYGLHGVRKAIAKSKIEKPTFWQIRDYLPKETRSYVPMFIATAKVFLNPKEYGINIKELNLQEEYKYDTYTIKEPISTKALAKCACIPLEKFNEYNPELISTTTPPDLPEYTVRIPEGSKSTFIITLATLTPEEKRPWITHTVGNRETIASIAERYGLSKEALLSANTEISGKKKLKKGTIIHIPVESMIPDNLANKKGSDKDEEDEITPENNPNIKYINHEVVKGETLYNIAQRYNVNISDIKGWNNLSDKSDDLVAGTTLKIGVSKKLAAVQNQIQSAPVKKITNPVVVKHVVRQGETLAQIADDYKVSIDDIRKWNKLDNSIKKGQSLRIVTIETKSRTSTQSYAKVTDAEPVKKHKKEESYAQVSSKHKVSYKVKKGDNLSSIAAKYGVEESDIKKWNKKTISGSKVLSGTRLNIMLDEPQKGSSASASKKINKLPKYYTVRKNDTLKDIADKFGVSVKSIKQKNKNITDVKLQKGQKIRIQ